jgi:hypothetical protein
VFQMYVVNVSSGCFKSRSWCYTCCNDYTHMFQAHVLSVSFASDVCCKCFIWTFQKQIWCCTDVAMSIHACFNCSICFRRMLKVFYLDVSKVDLGKHMMLLLGRRRGSPRTPASAVCKLRVVPAHAWACTASEAGWVRGEEAGCVRCRHGSAVRH